MASFTSSLLQLNQQSIRAISIYPKVQYRVFRCLSLGDMIWCHSLVCLSMSTHHSSMPYGLVDIAYSTLSSYHLAWCCISFSVVLTYPLVPESCFSKTKNLADETEWQLIYQFKLNSVRKHVWQQEYLTRRYRVGYSLDMYSLLDILLSKDAIRYKRSLEVEVAPGSLRYPLRDLIQS